ncbi:MAG: hypothetical protein JWM10_4598, partial [Myxococcaceae bacterium]|nr:hypothetical protein [Myxococcaceae bacterium]
PAAGSSFLGPAAAPARAAPAGDPYGPR